MYCFLCGTSHPYPETNNDHIVPYALGNRNVVIRVGKSCNAGANSVFDNAFANLDDVTLGRARYGHGDRKNRVPKPAIEGTEERGGITTLHRIDVRDGQVIGNRVDRAQRLYGRGRHVFNSTQELTEERLLEGTRQLQQAVQRSRRPSGIEIGGTFLYLPAPGMFNDSRTSAEVTLDTRVRTQELLKILLGRLALVFGADLEQFSFVAVVRSLLGVTDDQEFLTRSQNAVPHVATGLIHSRPHAVPGQAGDREEIVLNDTRLLTGLGLKAESLLPPSVEAPGGHTFESAVELLSFQHGEKSHHRRPFLIQRAVFYGTFRSVVLCQLRGEEVERLAEHPVPTLVIPFGSAP